MKNNDSINLSRIYSYFVGGQNKTVSGAGVRNVSYSLSGLSRSSSIDGDYEHGQMYVQVFEQKDVKHDSPMLMWHGGGMTGTVWESTADGEPGWLDYFLKKGYSVQVSDSVKRGRSGFDPTTILSGTPLFRSKQEAWNLFRVGQPEGYNTSPLNRQPFEGSRFPVQHFDNYCRSFVARFETDRDQTVAAYRQQVTENPNSIILAHSQGGGFALQTVILEPTKIKAVIAIEPSGAPQLTDEIDIQSICETPHLIVWGDQIKKHSIWREYRAAVDAYATAIKEKGGQIDIITLPDIGIRGNSHCPMSDDNSVEVAEIIASWLERTSNSLPKERRYEKTDSGFIIDSDIQWAGSRKNL